MNKKQMYQNESNQQESRKHLTEQVYEHRGQNAMRLEDLQFRQENNQKNEGQMHERNDIKKSDKKQKISLYKQLNPFPGEQPKSIEIQQLKMRSSQINKSEYEREEIIFQEEQSRHNLKGKFRSWQTGNFTEQALSLEKKLQYDAMNYLSFSLVRDESETMGGLRPKFHFSFLGEQKKKFIHAKLTSKNTTSTILLGKNRDEFIENSQQYLGKIKGNFSNTVFNIFGPGYSPSDAKSKNQKQRQMLATVEYLQNQNGFFSAKHPKKLKVYILKQNYEYNQLIGITRRSQQISLNQLYEENKEKISMLVSRKPEWSESQGSYYVKFHGKVKKTSVKNFILEDKDKNERMEFGKIRDNEYQADLWSPLTPFIGFSIALTTFVSSN